MSYVLPGAFDRAVLTWNTNPPMWRANKTPPVIDGFIAPSRDVAMATAATNTQVWTYMFNGIKLPGGLVYLYVYVYTYEYAATNLASVTCPGVIPIGFRISANSSRNFLLSNGQTMVIQFQTTGAVIFYRPGGSASTYVNYSGGIWYRTSQ